MKGCSNFQLSLLIKSCGLIFQIKVSGSTFTCYYLFITFNKMTQGDFVEFWRWLLLAAVKTLKRLLWFWSFNGKYCPRVLGKRMHGRLRFCTFLHVLYPRPRKLPIFSIQFRFGLNVKNAVTDKWYVLTFYSAPPGALQWKNNRIKRITGGCNSEKIFTFLLLGPVQTPNFSWAEPNSN